MEYLADYGLFVAKAITIVLATLAVVGGVLSLVFRHRRPSTAKLEIEHLNKTYTKMEKRLNAALQSDEDLRAREKVERKLSKTESKSAKKAAKKAARSGNLAGESSRRVFVLDFDGDIRATAVTSLREEITAVLTVATPKDEVLVRLESAGGIVYSYGLAASQLQRVRDADIPLTVSVDKIAASGGYMMACVGSHIIAAPFSMIGSIGVVVGLPNFSRVLKKHEIDYEQLYAGKYKRTLTMFGENTDAGREKMKEDLEETHALFKDHVLAARPSIDVEQVATGEVWLGTRALELGLIDELKTSDDYLMSARKDAELIKLRYTEKKGMLGSLGDLVSAAVGQRDKLAREERSQHLL